MAHQVAAPMTGTSVYWEAAKSTRLESLAADWKSYGLEKYIPEPRTPLACLKAAIADVFDVKEIVDDPKLESRVIEPQPKGFVVGVKRPKVHKNPGQSLGTTKISITLDDKGEIDMDPWDGEKVRLLKEGMAGARLWLASGPVVSALRDIVTTWGLALGSCGGWYWISEQMMPCWEQVEESLIRASAKQDKDGEDAAPWVFDHWDLKPTERTIIAIIRNLKAEMESEVAGIEYELQNGGLGQRAIESRERRSEHLLSKVAKFAETLQVDLDDLQNNIQARIQSAAAMAKLAAIVKAEQEQGVAA